jgi:hypothetical protein
VNCVIEVSSKFTLLVRPLLLFQADLYYVPLSYACLMKFSGAGRKGTKDSVQEFDRAYLEPYIQQVLAPSSLW